MVDKVDALSVSSRSFYERTKSKLVFSFVIGSIAMMVLGFCSIAGGLSLAAGNEKDVLEQNGSILFDFIKILYYLFFLFYI
jgi:hypothetical protein